MITTLIQLLVLFSTLSLLAFGGGNAIIPQMLETVTGYTWMSGQEFLDIFAISRATPGPGTLFVILVGLKAAGLAGAVVAFVGMFAPAGLLVHLMARFWHRAQASVWYALVEQALGPIGIGLTFASALALLQASEYSLVALGVTAASASVLGFTETHPVWVMLAGAGLLFALG
ncbi:MAG: chromate transporter [Acetobacteraceae bacterium]|nr:chromate transporter [Acetobacteraceae bacterium]